MVKSVSESKSVQIPPGVEVKVEGGVVTAKGPLGEVRRDFSYSTAKIERSNDDLRVEAYWPNKKEASMVGTISSHIRNMMKGVTEGFTYRLKAVYAHFPLTVKVQDGTVVIENFGGERSPRVARIVGDTKVSVEGDDVTIKGIVLEDVSQTAANIQQATKTRKRDPRVFLDGVYVYKESVEM